MPRRIDIELTSSRDDGSWTWRAAGAKEPRGTVDGKLMPAAAKVGDVLKVDAEFFVDGIEITGVAPPKGPRSEPERLELLLPAEEAPLVTSSVTSGPSRDRVLVATVRAATVRRAATATPAGMATAAAIVGPQGASHGAR